jgi:hypothetical protein
MDRACAKMTGLFLDEGGAIRAMDAADWQKRK